MKDYSYDNRKYIISGVMILVLLIYVARLYNLQIDSSDYKTKADSNAFYKKTVYPARGLMYDRNGKLVVYNKPSYDITFVPREIKEVDTLELCRALGITVDDFNGRMERVRNKRINPGYSTYTEQELMTQLTGEEFAGEPHP